MLTSQSDLPAVMPATEIDLSAVFEAAVTGDDLIAIVVAISDERDQWERIAIDFGRVGYIDGYAEGYRARMAEENQEFAATPRTPVIDGTTLAELAAKRWELRGEQRTRETFGQPHPQDR